MNTLPTMDDKQQQNCCVPPWAPSSTVQVNVGRQFQWLAPNPSNPSLTINEAILLTWSFQNQRQLGQQGVMVGLSTKQGNFPRPLDPKARKRKQAVDPGRPPDTKRQLGKRQKKKRKAKMIEPCFICFGIKCGILKVATMTCPLDSVLMMLHIPFLCEILCKPFPELSDPESLLSRSFERLRHGDTDGSDARILWMTEFLGPVIKRFTIHDLKHSSSKHFQTRNIRSSTWDLVQHCSNLKKDKKVKEEEAAEEAKTHPLKETLEVTHKQQKTCLRVGGCRGQSLISDCCHDSDGEDILSEEDDKEVEGRKVQSKTRSRFHCIDSKKSVVECIDERFKGKMNPSCCGNWKDPDNVTKKNPMGCRKCEGPEWVEEGEITEWPHCIAVDVLLRKLVSMPDSFVCRNRRLVLRSVMLLASSKA